MNIGKKIVLATLGILVVAGDAAAYKLQPVKYGNMDNWITRKISESSVIGGKEKVLYEIGPTQTITGNKAYYPASGNPWATSNVYAKVKGITKGSNAVYPATRAGHGKCVKLASEIETVKVLGIINMDVMVAGTIFFGRMVEPISSTSNPYQKMETGAPFTGRPKALVFDYAIEKPATNTRVKATGFGSKKTLQGADKPVVFVMLQRRWEDAQGNIHAKRVASGVKKFSSGTGWVNGYALPLIYGDPTGKPGYDASVLGLRSGKNAYYAKNSKGKMVPIIEEGWDSPDMAPTHAIVQFSAGSGEPYVGTPGLTMYVDNVNFGY